MVIVPRINALKVGQKIHAYRYYQKQTLCGKEVKPLAKKGKVYYGAGRPWPGLTCEDCCQQLRNEMLDTYDAIVGHSRHLTALSVEDQFQEACHAAR